MTRVILVPRRQDHGRRDQIWMWVKSWVQGYLPDYQIYEGYDDEADSFSMGKARNQAARDAGDWDVAVVLDADTIAHPDAIRAAAEMALATPKLIVAGDVRMRMDKASSDRILNGGMWFPRPEGKHPKIGIMQDTCYGEPSSGVIAVNRALWEGTGGYVETLRGWGFEDLIFITQCWIAGEGMDWVPDSILLHFWHERTDWTEDTHRNNKIRQEFHDLSLEDREQAKDYLRSYGHKW